MKKSLILLLVVCGIWVVDKSVYAGNGWGVRQISSGKNVCSARVEISGKNAVWSEEINGKWQVMFWDGTTPRQLSTGENNCNYDNFRISGGNVVWTESINNNYQVFLWDGTTPKQISTGAFAEYLQISGSNVVWLENYNQIMFWDGSKTRQISNGANPCSELQISGNKVVWIENRQVMLWDGTAVRQISNAANWCVLGQIEGLNVVWCENINNEYYVMLWDGTIPKQISIGSSLRINPRISNGDVVWLNHDHLQVLLWDGTSARQIAQGEKNFRQDRPDCFQFSGNYITWVEGDDSSHGQIKLWDGTTTKTLTRPSQLEHIGISDNLAVWTKCTDPYSQRGYCLYCYDGNSISKVAESRYYMGYFSISGTNIALSMQEEYDDMQIFIAEQGRWNIAEPISVGQVKTGSTTGIPAGYDFTERGYKDTVDIWYSFTAPYKGDFVIGTLGSNFDTTLAVFDDDYNEIEFNDNYNCKQSKLTLRAAAGVKYYIRIAGYNGQTGNYRLSIIDDGPNPLVSDINADGNVDTFDFAILAGEWLKTSK